MPHPDFWRELKAIIRANNHRNRRGAIASFAWQAKRAEILHAAFRTLWTLGFRPVGPRRLRQRHVQALACHWEEAGIRDIQTRMSVLRTYANEWLGKSGMVRESAHYVRDPQSVTRSYVAKRDKSWSGQGVNVEEILARVQAVDPRIGAILELQFRFGLRLKEAMLFQPHLCDRGSHIAIERGAKGGRPRSVPVAEPEQLALLARIRTFAPTNASTMIPPEFRLITYRKRIYDLARRLGLTRQNGLNLHGLRHEYAARRYADLTGHPGPLKSDTRIEPEDDLTARLVISQDLGHTRKYIVGAYVGGRRVVIRRASARSKQVGDTNGKRPEVEDETLTRRRLLEPCPDPSPEIPDPVTTPTMPHDKKKQVTEVDMVDMVVRPEPMVE
jgi:integrase